MNIGFGRFVAGSLVFLAFFITGCYQEPSARTDAEMKARIIGTWVMDDGPLSLYYMEKTHSPDGTSTGFLLNRQTGKRIDFTSRWQIKGGHYTGQVITSSDPDLPPGASFSTQVLKMTDKQFVTTQDGTGRLTFSYRKGRFALF
jgi:hypothetical protein